jgi:hypothetical protein
MCNSVLASQFEHLAIETPYIRNIRRLSIAAIGRGYLPRFAHRIIFVQ